MTAPASWTVAEAAGLRPRGPDTGIHPEFTGYAGELVKQADVTMLQYPWNTHDAAVAQADLDYYVARTDPTGPLIANSVTSIDTVPMGAPGCSAYVYAERSVEPFIRDQFDQFSETPPGGPSPS